MSLGAEIFLLNVFPLHWLESCRDGITHRFFHFGTFSLSCSVANHLPYRSVCGIEYSFQLCRLSNCSYLKFRNVTQNSASLIKQQGNICHMNTAIFAIQILSATLCNKRMKQADSDVKVIFFFFLHCFDLAALFPFC